MQAARGVATKRLLKRAFEPVTIEDLDALFSKIILTRDGHRCQKCGTAARMIVRTDGIRQRQSPAAHHIFSRAYRGTRWDIDNGIALCLPCHFWFSHGRYEEFRDWIIRRIGEAGFLRLKYRALAGGGTRGAELPLVKIHLEQEMNKLIGLPPGTIRS